MSYLTDLYDYLGASKQTLAGLVSAMRPAVGELNGDLAASPRVAILTVNYDDASDAVLNLDSGAVVLDAKAFVTLSFDAGTTNEVQFALGAADVPGGGSLLTFAYARDVTLQNGSPVTGYDFNGTDTDPFLPARIGDNTAIYVGYRPAGTAATQGQALVWITYLPA